MKRKYLFCKTTNPESRVNDELYVRIYAIYFVIVVVVEVGVGLLRDGFRSVISLFHIYFRLL